MNRVCVSRRLASDIGSLFAFAFFRKHFDADNGLFCDTLAQCFLSSSSFGLRFGGGLGENLDQVTIFDNVWLARYFYDMVFYLIVAVFGLNFVLGIIVDNFSEHRANGQSRETILASSCFICGLPAEKFAHATSSNGFHQHTAHEHYLLDYLAFIKYIKIKHGHRCSYLETLVKRGWVDPQDTEHPQWDIRCVVLSVLCHVALGATGANGERDAR